MDERKTTAGRFADPEEAEVRSLLERAGPRPPIPQEDLDEINAHLRSAWRFQLRRHARTTRRRPAWPLAAALAAALALTSGLGWWWFSQRERVSPGTRSQGAQVQSVARLEAATGPVSMEVAGGTPRALAPGEAIPTGAALSTGAGEPASRALLTLASGVSVRLDKTTRLHFVSATEISLAQGAVYADTGAGAGARLAVETPLGTARDIGTRFAVRVDGQGGALSVQVRDGAVEVERDGSTRVAPAGEELVLYRDGTEARRARAPYGPEWDWVLAAARFEVEGRKVGDFLDWVARETGWQIRFANEELARPAREIVLRGGIGGLRPDQAPFVVLPGAGLEGELAGGTLIVRRR